MEYYKNLSLEDLFYINENGLVCLEEWRDIPNYEGLYQTSDLGRVKSFLNKKRVIILKQSLLDTGYLTVTLCCNKNKKSRTIHTLVAESFLNHVSCGYELIVEHKDHIRNNNILINLKIITTRENTDQKHLESTSKYVGVYLKPKNKWSSAIWINGEQKHLGTFDNEIEASEYYQNALKNYQLGLAIEVKPPIYSSKYKGVCWSKRKSKWMARIFINGKEKFLGYFEDELEAYNIIIKEKTHLL